MINYILIGLVFTCGFVLGAAVGDDGVNKLTTIDILEYGVINVLLWPIAVLMVLIGIFLAVFKQITKMIN